MCIEAEFWIIIKLIYTERIQSLSFTENFGKAGTKRHFVKVSHNF